MLRILRILALSAVIIPLFMTFSQSHTLAANYHQTQTHMALVDACYNNNNNSTYGKQLCNGDDPQTSGCGMDAYTVISAYISNNKGTHVGFVELRYSPHCGTNWARTTSYIGPTEIDNLIGYSDPFATNGCQSPVASYVSGDFNATQSWSAMIYAPTAVAFAIGEVSSVHIGNCVYA